MFREKKKQVSQNVGEQTTAGAATAESFRLTCVEKTSSKNSLLTLILSKSSVNVAYEKFPSVQLFFI